MSEKLQAVMYRAGVGSQTLSKLTGIPRTAIDNWRDGSARRPRHWRPLLQIAQTLALSTAEANALLAAAGYPPVARLAATLPLDDSDWHYLQPFLKPTSSSIPQDLAQRLVALEAQLAGTREPPTRALHQLRAPIADFVGREEAITTLLRALQSVADNGVVAAISGVRGMGGIGKTELAYLVAQRLRDTFPDGQIVINLRGVSATPLLPTQALQQVIHAFTPDAQLPDDIDTLLQHYCAVLHRQRVLIVADDARDAMQVQPLLPPAGCALLVTSRMRFTLPGMTAVDLEQLDANAAVALLRSICERLTTAEAQAIAQACGYLPLALRISASVLHSDPALPVGSYLARLTDAQVRLSQLQDPDDAGRDVAAALALSYTQLDAAAQHVFRQLGVFVSDFATPLALSVVEAADGVDVEATMRQLLRRNLIMYDAARSRWRLHDLLGDLARQKLVVGELEMTMWRYARAAVKLVQAIQGQYLAGGEEVLAALAQFDAERPHIDAARRWAAQAGTQSGDQLLVDAATATAHIGVLRYDTRREHIPQWEDAYAAARRLGDQRAEGLALNRLGVFYADLGEVRRAIPTFQQALAIARAIGDQRQEGRALGNLGVAYANLGEARHAIPYYEQVLTIARALGDQRTEGHTLGNLGSSYIDLGEAQRAILALEQALTIAGALGERRNEGEALGNLGIAYARLGEAQRAIPALEQALTIARALGDLPQEGDALAKLGSSYTYLGQAQRAIPVLEQALTIARALGDLPQEGRALYKLGSSYTYLGQAQRAIPVLEQALTIARAIGDRRLEGYILGYLARAHAQQGNLAHATTTFAQTLALFEEIGDRWGEAECQWLVGLALAQAGEQGQALPLLCAAVAYEQAIGHAKASEHAVLLARLEAGEPLPSKDMLFPVGS